MKVGIIYSADIDSIAKYISACQTKGLEYEPIDLCSSNWLERVKCCNADFFVQRPEGTFEYRKYMYDERLFIIDKVLNYKVFPGYDEVHIYENKKFLSYYLEAKQYPHAKTDVFYNKTEALQFAETCSLPIVGKINIGASGSGVKILKTRNQVNRYVCNAFSSKGIKRRFGPNRVIGNPKKWLTKALNSPRFFIKKVKQYFSVYKDGQKGYLLFQSFVHHDFEWRVAKIGNSYFAHQKVKVGEKASGSKGINYVNPPLEILNFVKDICDKNHFTFMTIDIFEDGKGGYLVNEMQTIFGHVQPYIMKVDGVVGRYVYDNGWKFEAGDFNTNESYDLRLEYVLSLYNGQ